MSRQTDSQASTPTPEKEKPDTAAADMAETLVRIEQRWERGPKP